MEQETTEKVYAVTAAGGLALYLRRRRRGRLVALVRERLRSRDLAYGLAALFLLAVPLIRYSTVEQLTRPTPIPIYHCSTPHCGSEPIRLPPGTDQFLLILNLTAQRPYTDYTVKILDTSDPESRVAWSRTGLEARSAGNFNLKMRRGFLGPGPHAIQLYGREGETSELLAEYRVRIADG